MKIVLKRNKKSLFSSQTDYRQAWGSITSKSSLQQLLQEYQIEQTKVREQKILKMDKASKEGCSFHNRTTVQYVPAQKKSQSMAY